MASPHDLPTELHSTYHEMLDPGASGTITVDRQFAYVPLASAAAETRTLARPTRHGIYCYLNFTTDGGDITLTVTGGINEDGDTTFTFSDAGQFLLLVSASDGTTYYWRKVSDYAAGVLTPTEAGFLEDVTAGTGAASKAVVLDANGSVTLPSGGELALDGNTLATEAGTGITAGTGTVYESSVLKVGGVIFTNILIDLTGLHSEATDLDIIGVDGSSNPAHIGRITAARNGTILGGVMRCLEAPAGGDPNIALYSATESTGVEDALISSLTETLLFDPDADWTIDMDRSLAAVPAANEYLYLVQGDATGTDADYTAGKFLITLYGYDA
jgi:hypothetical protein